MDVGAGTGKFTRAIRTELAHNWSWNRHQRRVLAVEPVAEMRMAMEERAAREGDGVGAGNRVGNERTIVVDGRADALPLADGSAGNIVCGQAFHWPVVIL